MTSSMTEPGLEIFSKEWLLRAFEGKLDPLSEAVRAICEGYQIGGSGDPKLIHDMIVYTTSKYLRDNNLLAVMITSEGEVVSAPRKSTVEAL